MISAAIGGNVLGRGNYRKSLSFDLDAPRAARWSYDPLPSCVSADNGPAGYVVKNTFSIHRRPAASRAPEKFKVRHYLRKHRQRDFNYTDFRDDERLFRVIFRITRFSGRGLRARARALYAYIFVEI